MKRTASNAIVQVQAQVVMLEKFGAMIGQKLIVSQIVIDGTLFQFDGYSESDCEIILAECWAHIGKAKVAQRHKIAADVLKLSLAAERLRQARPGKAIKCYLIFADDEAAEVVRCSSWLSAAARHYGVSPIVIQLDESIRQAIRQAQKAQDLRDPKPDTKSNAASAS